MVSSKTLTMLEWQDAYYKEAKQHDELKRAYAAIVKDYNEQGANLTPEHDAIVRNLKQQLDECSERIRGQRVVINSKNTELHEVRKGLVEVKNQLRQVHEAIAEASIWVHRAQQKAE